MAVVVPVQVEVVAEREYRYLEEQSGIVNDVCTVQ